MKKATIAAFLSLVLFIPAASFAATNFQEDFTNTITNGCQADGAKFGSWEVRYASYGCVKVEDGAVVIQPQVATSAGETHAPLILGPNVPGDIDFTVRMKTDSQLRKNSAPNAWEVGWVLWDYTDDTHFYSLVLKPNGWELGKEDPVYGGAQRFLATGSDTTFPIGQWYTVRIVRAGNKITAYVNGILLTTFTDTERPYSGGRIGLYNEDAITRFDDVIIGNSVVPPAVTSAAAAVSVAVPAPTQTTVSVPSITITKQAQNNGSRRHRRYSYRAGARVLAWASK